MLPEYLASYFEKCSLTPAFSSSSWSLLNFFSKCSVFSLTFLETCFLGQAFLSIVKSYKYIRIKIMDGTSLRSPWHFSVCTMLKLIQLEVLALPHEPFQTQNHHRGLHQHALDQLTLSLCWTCSSWSLLCQRHGKTKSWSTVPYGKTENTATSLHCNLNVGKLWDGLSWIKGILD